MKKETPATTAKTGNGSSKDRTENRSSLPGTSTPILGPAEREDIHGDALFALTNAACVTECTGLIQVPPQNQDEMENYNDVYSFTKSE